MKIREFLEKTFCPYEYEMSQREKRRLEIKLKILVNMEPISAQDVEDARRWAYRPTNYYVGDIQVKEYNKGYFYVFLVARSLAHLSREQAKSLTMAFNRDLWFRDKVQIIDRLLEISEIEKNE